MHEYPVTQSIIQIAEKRANEHQKKVTEVILVVGEYSGYLAECIELYFDILSEGTPLAGARLTIKKTEALLKCPSCGNLFKRKPFDFHCPKCQTDGEPTDIGREFYVESVLLADE